MCLRQHQEWAWLVPLAEVAFTEQRRFLRSLEIGLGRGHGQSVPICQVTRGGPPATPSPGAALPQESCRVQTNLAGPHPRLGLALRDTTGRLVTSGFQQQSNLWSPAGRPQGKARESALQQENLWGVGRGSTPLRESQRPLAHQPLCVRPVPGATAVPCPDLGPATGFGPLGDCPRPGPRAWRDLGCWTARLVGEPLTLEDLAVPAQRQAQAPPHTATCLLLASVKHLEQEAARLRSRMSREPAGRARWGPRAHQGQACPARPLPSRPVLASRDEKRPPRGLLETWGVQAGPTDSGAHSQPQSSPATLGTFTAGFLDPEQGVLPAQPPGRGDKCPPEPTHGRETRGTPSLPQRTGDMEARLTSSAFSSAAGDVLPGQEGGGQPLLVQASREEERTERTASCPPATTPVRRSARQSKAHNGVTPEPQAARWQLLSRCFGAWRRLAWRRGAVAAAVALSRRRLLRKGLRALRWALWLREAQLEVAWGRHTKALLARSFQEWRCLALRQEQGRPHVHSVSRPPRHGPSLGRVAVVDAAQRSRPAGAPSPGRPRQEEGTRPRPLQPGRRAEDGDGRVQALQALQQLAVFLLQCPQKARARQEQEALEEPPRAPQGTGRMASPPQAWHPPAAGASVAPQPWRALLPRCSLAPAGAQAQNRPADHRLGTLRACLGRWVQMKQLRASDSAKVTQLSLCLKKAGHRAVHSSTPGATTAHGLGTVAQAQGPPQEPGQGSLQEACRRLTLSRALQLWRTRLCQHQQATSFSQGLRERTLRCTLSWWRLRAWARGTLSGSSKATSALGPRGSGLRGEARLGCRAPPGSLEQAPRSPVLLEPLRVSFLWAAGRRRQRQGLLLWRARAQQSRGAARWCQRSLRRRVLLSWSHWTAAQGARRQSAARWAWDRSCRAALGLWRQRLAQWQQAEQRAQERGRSLAREALHRWHSSWQRQQVLREKHQQWTRGRLRGLRRAVFRGWRQAAARGGQRDLTAWAQSVAQGRVQQATITQLQQAGLRRLLWTHWAQWQMALLRVRQEPRTQAQRMDLEHWPRLASRGRLALMDTPAPWKQARSCWTRAAGPALPWPTWEPSHGAERTQKETTWAQSDSEHPLCPAFRFWVQWPGRSSWASSWLPSGPRAGVLGSPHTRALHSQGKAPQRQLGYELWRGREEAPACALAQLGSLASAPSCRIREEQPQAPGPGEALRLLVTRRKYLQRWRLKAWLHRLQASRDARRLVVAWRCWVHAQGVQQLSQALLRQWHLGHAWRMWRRRALQLRVAVRLQQQQDGWVLSQAFEKWHQCLAAKSRRRGTTSSPSPLPGQAPGPWEQAGSCSVPGVAGLDQNRGPACGRAFPQNGKQGGAQPSRGGAVPPHGAPRQGREL